LLVDSLLVIRMDIGFRFPVSGFGFPGKAMGKSYNAELGLMF